MGNKPIFLSMAAIDGERAGRYQWLPEILGRQENGLFPQQYHSIAAPTRPYDCQKIAFVNRKIYIG